MADVTEVLFDGGCNLQDVTSTILRGNFAMLMVVGAPAASSAADLERALAEAPSTQDLVVVVRDVADAVHDVPPATHMVSVYGADQPGIVRAVSRALADAGASITDLASRVIGGTEDPVYALMMEIATDDPVAMDAALARVREDLRVDVSVHALDVDVL